MLDDVDRGLLHALHLDGRAPFARIAEVLGVSTQTVVRRHRRLRETAGLRVVGLPDPGRRGTTRWLVRIGAGPQSAQEIARTLARRNDTSWVRLASGGTEIVAVVHAVDGSDHALLLRDIPRTSTITSVSAHHLLHTYLGGPTTWSGRTDTLTPAQQDALTRPETDPSATATVTDADTALLDALARDGRTSLAELADRIGRSAATVARRLEALRASGAVYFDVEFDDAVFGAGTSVLLWLAVAPAHLDRAATEMAGHAEPAFVASTTGPTNLAASLPFPDAESLHRYLIGPLAELPGVQTVETAPILRTVKSVGPLPRPGVEY